MGPVFRKRWGEGREMEKKKRIIKCPAAGEGEAAEPLRGRAVNGRPELQARQNYGLQRGLEIRTGVWAPDHKTLMKKWKAE